MCVSVCTPPNITCRPQCCCHYRGPHVRASSRFGAVTSSYTLDGGYGKTGVMVLSWTPLRVADGAKAKGRWRPRLKHNLGVIMPLCFYILLAFLPSLRSRRRYADLLIQTPPVRRGGLCLHLQERMPLCSSDCPVSLIRECELHGQIVCYHVHV